MGQLIKIFCGLILFISAGNANVFAQYIPPVPNPTIEACVTSDNEVINCGDSWKAVKNGVTYDCTCNCSGSSPRCIEVSSSSRSSVVSPDPVLTPLATPSDQERQEAFEKAAAELMGSLKGRTSTATPVVLKTATTAATELNPVTTSLPLKVSAASSSAGLQTNEAATTRNTTERERTIQTIKELNCSAFWGLSAARAALDSRLIVTTKLDDQFTQARKYAENSALAKDGKPVSGCPNARIAFPDALPSIGSNPQIKVYNYIIQQTNILVPAIIETQKNIQITRQYLKDTEVGKANNRKRIEPIVSALIETKDEAEKNKLKKEYKECNDEYDQLIKDAMAANEEADQQDAEANVYVSKYTDLQDIYSSVLYSPERAKEFVK